MNIGQWYTYDGTPESSTTSHEAGIDVMVVSQNEINNTSLVRVRPWGVKFSGSTYNLSQQTLTVKVNNSTKTSKTSYDFREATTDKKFYLTSGYPFKKHSGSGSLVSGAYVYDFTVKHNDNGTKTIPIYALIPFHNSASGRDWEVDIDLELPDIPRKNTLTYSYTTLEKPITFKIVKSSSNFTSTINLSFSKEGSTTELIGLGDIFTKTSSTNLSYTLTEENLNEVLSFNKTETDVTALVIITTFSKNQSLGSEMYSFSIPIKKTKPIVSATFVDTNATTIALTGDSSKIVKYISKPKVTITAQAQQQADISSYSTVWGNSSSTAQETTFNSGIDSNILTVSAKDSRNWVGEQEYNLSTLGKYVEYIKPNFSKFTLSRPESTSNTINADLTGVWFNNSFGTTSNTLELKYRYKEKGGEYGEYQTITLTTNENNFSFNGSIGSSFNYQKQYDFEFVLTDKLMSVITTFNVTSGESIIRVAETYVRILGDIKHKGNYELEGNANVNGSLTINERNVYPNQNIICVTNSALYELTQTNVYEQIQNLVIENQLGSDLSLVDNAIVIGEGISKILVNFSLTYDGVGGVGAKFIRLSKNEVDNGYRMLSKSNISTSGTQNYRIFMNSGDVLIDVVKGDKIMLFVYGTAGDTIPRNTFNYFIFTVRAVA